MFCVNCGVAVSDEASFCAGCGRPVAAGDAVSPAPAREARDFGKIRKMNIVGAIGIGLLWAALFASMWSKMSPLMFGVFLVVALLTVGAPAATAFALSKDSGKALHAMAIGLNIALILLWILSVVEAATRSPSSLFESLFGALFYVVPEVMNLKALRAIKSSAATQGEAT